MRQAVTLVPCRDVASDIMEMRVPTRPLGRSRTQESMYCEHSSAAQKRA